MQQRSRLQLAAIVADIGARIARDQARDKVYKSAFRRFRHLAQFYGILNLKASLLS